MLRINMFSSADKVKGQGVGSAYIELINMLNKHFSTEFDISINKFKQSDISHYHTVDPQFFISTFFKKKRGTTIGYVHFLPETLEGSLTLFSPFKKIFDWYLIRFYGRMDQLVVVNPTFIPKLVEAGLKEERITYIPNFVSNKTFYEATIEEKKDWRKKYQIPEEKLVILGTGQIQQRKGIDDFVQLAIDNPDSQFIWAGGFSFGKITDGYDRYKKIYDNPPKNLLFTGIVDREEIMRLYNLADVFLLPSYNELFPMSILEAFNCGTPVMLRDLELYHAIIDEQYISTKDINDMNKEIDKIKKNPQILKEYQQKSKNSALYYSEENVAKIWYDYYKESAKEEN
ncbi:glycosyltransferase family 4 protein [Vagococcus bubulae]|uniref:Glycosyltransferase n=1 Tax=Vagococcus bubulae TaxID=1977868 RepID=A0A429ZQE9_9ENTE|nr:glycosyltransferase family 4 protein [Vagococcus bubulae]RST95901.1 glycosyltransferase [Vagococcus bubulae]